jgi:hypothetical protein
VYQTTKYKFCNFYCDDHLTTVMFLDEAKKTLDYNLMLWTYDTAHFDLKALQRAEQNQRAVEDRAQEPNAFAQPLEKLKCVIF